MKSIWLMMPEIKTWLAVQKKERPTCYVLGKAFAIIILVLGIVEILITLSDVVAAEIARRIHPSNATFLNLSASIILAAATTGYVMLTYSIARSTKNSILQSERTNLHSEKMMRQTANSEKIRSNERKLELFYLPLKTAISRFDVDRILELNDEIKNVPCQHRHYSIDQVCDMWHSFKEDYDKVIPYSYLACTDAQKLLGSFTRIFESNRLFAANIANMKNGEDAAYTKITELIQKGWLEKYFKDVEEIAQIHKSIMIVIDKEVNHLKEQLNILVNQ